MATWVSHFRLAENLLNHGFKLDRTQFTIGNIAPDCGIPDEQHNYHPPSHITHFKTDGKRSNPDAFYQQHLAQADYPEAEYAFKLGYYAHLLADSAWGELIYHPKKVTPLWAAGLEGNPQFIWEIKKDWYGLDFIYLNENPDSLFYTVFNQVDSVADYFDFVPEGNFTKTVKRIQDYYTNEENMQLSLEHEYRYLSQAEMDDYIQQSTQSLISAFESIAVPLHS